MNANERSVSLGETHNLSLVDRLGIWLSRHKISSLVDSFEGRRVGDFGSGFRARTSRPFFDRAAHVTLIDVSLAPELKNRPEITVIEGLLPSAMGEVSAESTDISRSISVLEHLKEPQQMLDELFRVTASKGVCVINVPNWLGMQLHECSAFHLGLRPKFEMDDHKMYYGPHDLWHLLVGARFSPRSISIRLRKLRSASITVANNLWRDNRDASIDSCSPRVNTSDSFAILVV